MDKDNLKKMAKNSNKTDDFLKELYKADTLSIEEMQI